MSGANEDLLRQGYTKNDDGDWVAPKLRDLSAKAPDSVLVATIEGLLELAKRGELRGLAFAGIMLSGEGATGYTGIRRPYKIVGQIECLKVDVIRAGHHDEGNVRVEWTEE